MLRSEGKSDVVPIWYVISNIEQRLEGGRDGPSRWWSSYVAIPPLRRRLGIKELDTSYQVVKRDMRVSKAYSSGPYRL